MLNLMRMLTNILGQFKVTNIVYKPSDYEHLATNFVFTKQGNVVHASIGAVTNLATNTATELFTLPQEYRPTSGNISIDTIHSGTHSLARITIRTSGVVEVYNYSSNTGTINGRANATYIV